MSHCKYTVLVKIIGILNTIIYIQVIYFQFGYYLKKDKSSWGIADHKYFSFTCCNHVCFCKFMFVKFSYSFIFL